MTFASISDVATAAPLGFLVGFVVGVLLASHYVIIRPRNWRRRREGDDS